MKTPRQKITPDRRHELLQVYLNLGYGPASELSVEYGVARDYSPKHANEIGLQLRRKFKGGGKPAVSVNHADPRWARAIAIGQVVA